MKKTIRIEGMSCGHCTATVTKALNALNGVLETAVNLENKLATVELSDDLVSDAMLKEAVEEAGYEIIEIMSL